MSTWTKLDLNDLSTWPDYEKLKEEQRYRFFGSTVLVTTRKGEVCTGYLHGESDEWKIGVFEDCKVSVSDVEDIHITEVVAWMPLPEPYKGE